MKPVAKTLLRTAMVVLVVMAITGMWYKQSHSMKKVMPRVINDPSLANKVLIATQGSAFKDDVVNSLVERLQDREVYINIIDVDQLNVIHREDWKAIVLIHTWEIGQPPHSVSRFLRRSGTEGIIELTTTGDSQGHIEGVDGITSASRMDEVDRCVREVMLSLEPKIFNETKQQ